MKKILTLTILSMLSLAAFAFDVTFKWEDKEGYYDNTPSTKHIEKFCIRTTVASEGDCWDVVFEPDGEYDPPRYAFLWKNCKKAQAELASWFHNLPYYHAEGYKKDYIDENNHQTHILFKKQVIREIEIK